MNSNKDVFWKVSDVEYNLIPNTVGPKLMYGIYEKNTTY